MLKKRSRAVSSKQGLMSDHISPLSPTTKFTSLIPSPGFFVGFSPKGFSDTEASAVSPTSILEPKPFSTSGLNFSGRKPRASLNNSSETKHYPWDAADSKTVGLGILDALSHEKADKESSNVDSKKVFFGPQLKVQIPSDCQNSVFQTGSVVSPHSLIEFGVKSKNSQLAMALFTSARKSPTSEPSLPGLCLSASEMELRIILKWSLMDQILGQPTFLILASWSAAAMDSVLLGEFGSPKMGQMVILMMTFWLFAMLVGRSLDTGRISSCTEQKRHFVVKRVVIERCFSMMEWIIQHIANHRLPIAQVIQSFDSFCKS